MCFQLVSARYTNTYDAVNGIIVTRWSNYWPPAKIPDQHPKPVLYKWSDVTYLEWVKQKNTQNLPNTHPKELSYIVFTDLQKRQGPPGPDNGRETNFNVKIIFDIMMAFHKPGPPVWKDRQKVSRFTDGSLFDALIGTTPGQMVTDLLSQHKPVLGARSVNSVTIWSDQADARERNDRNSARFNLIFEIIGGPGKWDPSKYHADPNFLITPLQSEDEDFDAWAECARGGGLY